MHLTRLEEDVDEETPFLQSGGTPRKRAPTPLPRTQIAILLSIWVAEAVASHSIGPYLNQLIRELPIVGGDGRKVGYYTGIIVSLHHAAQVVTAFHWNRLSDHVGRKPVLLTCLAGTIVSIIMFGLSRSFWMLALSRFLHGALKGNIGVLKSLMAELTDETSAAQGFSMLPVATALGYMIGPFIGGILSRPQNRWPNLFSHPFWGEYPYFLPCLAVSAFACLPFAITAMYLKETVEFNHSARPRDSAHVPQQGGSSDSLVTSPSRNGKGEPPPLRCVITKPVMISIASFATIVILDSAATALIPLIWSTPIEFGGLNLSPASIGLWMSGYGCMNGTSQLALFPRAVRRFGLRRVFVLSVAACAVVYPMFPFENLALRRAAGGSKMTVWSLVALQLFSLTVSRMGFSAASIYVSSAAPSRRLLGATNGLAQTVASVQGTIVPAATDWLFAFSITNDLLGGNFVYVVLVSGVCVGLSVAAQLPKDAWNHRAG
ncbi:MFS general substrate transporter [Lactarius psammicola]|nr:MFS general substrate transporter [Lactarius psammicola]